MNLFIDTLSKNAVLILYNNKNNIIDKIEWFIKWNESSSLIPKIDYLIKKNDLKYFDLDNIVVLNWPWSFTWIRTTILVVNTINYIINKNITPINYFDLYNNYPIIKQSSKRDFFVKFNKNSKIKIIEKEKLIELLLNKNIEIIYWNVDILNFKNIKIIDKINYLNIITKIEYKKFKFIEALYIKKPNIS